MNKASGTIYNSFQINDVIKRTSTDFIYFELYNTLSNNEAIMIASYATKKGLALSRISITLGDST
jgi:hypothetical protein